MRLLRMMELALATGAAMLLSIAGWVHPSFANAPPPPARPPVRPAPPVQPQQPDIRRLLTDGAQRHGIRPELLLAVAYWESGWDQSRISVTGAVGLLQVQPETASVIGPGLNINDPRDNIELGARILREDLDSAGGDEATALAAYYEGPAQVEQAGIEEDAQAYIDGVEALAARFKSGAGPP